MSISILDPMLTTKPQFTQSRYRTERVPAAILFEPMRTIARWRTMSSKITHFDFPALLMDSVIIVIRGAFIPITCGRILFSVRATSRLNLLIIFVTRTTVTVTRARVVLMGFSGTFWKRKKRRNVCHMRGMAAKPVARCHICQSRIRNTQDSCVRDGCRGKGSKSTECSQDRESRRECDHCLSFGELKGPVAQEQGKREEQRKQNESLKNEVKLSRKRTCR